LFVWDSLALGQPEILRYCLIKSLTEFKMSGRFGS
jgi:hypothetical protein